MRLDMDRVAGVLLAQACGDALGVPYEFGPSLDDSVMPSPTGGRPFGFEPGEYSDDTAMSICIAHVSATGADLTLESSLDEIAERWLEWSKCAKDVGTQTGRVFAKARRAAGSPAAAMRSAARAHALSKPGHVGNGALMRTAIVGLSRLHDRDHTAAAARAVAELTHADPLGLDSSVLWSEAVRVAVVEGRLDLESGLDLIPTERRSGWVTCIEAATGADSRAYSSNGFTVWALQAAWAAVSGTPTPLHEPHGHLRRSLEAAVRTGGDTDTVAAIAGGLLGARWGQQAVPPEWTGIIHGYATPESTFRAADLVHVARATASAGVAAQSA